MSNLTAEMALSDTGVVGESGRGDTIVETVLVGAGTLIPLMSIPPLRRGGGSESGDEGAFMDRVTVTLVTSEVGQGKIWGDRGIRSW